MNRRNNILASLDWVTIALFIVFVAMGWANIYASSIGDTANFSLNLSNRAGKELLWIGLAIVLALLAIVIDSKFYEAFAYPIYGAMVLLLLLVLVIGVEVKGATSWIAIGSFRLQPAEFMKFAAALALAKVLSRFNFRFSRLKDLTLAFAITFLPSALILLQNDTGSALVYASLILVMYRQGLSGIFLSSAVLAASYFIFTLVYNQTVVLILILAILCVVFLIKRMYRDLMLVGIIIGSIAAVLILLNLLHVYEYSVGFILLVSSTVITLGIFIKAFFVRSKFYATWGLFLLLSLGYTLSTDYVFNNVLELHQKTRIEVLLGIRSDPHGAGYHVNQSRIAIGSGGFSGKGFLKGTFTKFNYVPEQSTDFIFCAVGEEWGFLGSFTVIALFTFFLLRLIFLAERQRSTFSRIYGYGVFAIFLFHFAINIGMTIGLAPVIGIPLPFFSYGGSSLWSFTVLLFIFLKLDSNRMQVLS